VTQALRPYPEYKDSGVEWLGEVPAHWEVRRLKSLVNNVVDQTLETQTADAVVALENVESWTGRITQGSSDSPLESQLKSFKTDDVLFGKLRPYLAKVTRPSMDGSCVGEFLVLRTRLRSDMAAYIEHLLRSKPIIDAVNNSTFGARMPRADWRFVGGMSVVRPPAPEQAAIARYLDHVTESIDRYIRSRERLIELLEEKRRVATEELLQLQNLNRYRLIQVIELAQRPIKRTSDVVYTPIGLYNHGRGIFRKDPRYGNELGDSDFFWVKTGDLVISGQFAWEGAVALASDLEDGCVASHRFPIVRGLPGAIDTRFLWALFQTDWGQLLLEHHSRGSAGRNRPLNLGSLLKEEVPIPPLRSQLAIAEMIKDEFRVRHKILISIKLLREYRTRLIADVVTGKLDVRQAAAGLPQNRQPPVAEPADSIRDLASAGQAGME